MQVSTIHSDKNLTLETSATFFLRHPISLLNYHVKCSWQHQISYHLEPTPYCPGGGGGGVLIIFLGGGVPPGPENPYPISDQNIRFSIPYFRPDSQNVYPISDPVMCGKFGNSEWIERRTGRTCRPKRCSWFFLRDQCLRQHTLL